MFSLPRAFATTDPIPALDGNLFEFGSEHLTALLANVGALVESFWPIVLLIVGLVLGIWLVRSIIGIIGRRAR